MDKVISARIDASVAETLDRESKRLGVTKKRYLEQAIKHKASDDDRERATRRHEMEEALQATFGMWNDRPGTTEEIIADIRRQSQESYERTYREIMMEPVPDA